MHWPVITEPLQVGLCPPRYFTWLASTGQHMDWIIINISINITTITFIACNNSITIVHCYYYQYYNTNHYLVVNDAGSLRVGQGPGQHLSRAKVQLCKKLVNDIKCNHLPFVHCSVETDIQRHFGHSCSTHIHPLVLWFSVCASCPAHLPACLHKCMP